MIVPSWEELEEFNKGKPYFGAYLRELRERMQMSIMSASKQCDLPAQLWSDLEHGRKYASLEVLEKMSKVLETTPATLRLHQERLDHEMKLWLDKHQKVVQWLQALAKKDR